MRTRVQKWRNSLTLRIPKAFAGQAGLEANIPVDPSLMNGRLAHQAITQPNFSPMELLGRVTDKNLHGEVESAGLVGNDAW